MSDVVVNISYGIFLYVIDIGTGFFILVSIDDCINISNIIRVFNNCYFGIIESGFVLYGPATALKSVSIFVIDVTSVGNADKIIIMRLDE